jgi:uncharacterized protein YprB with RNaseH-like and TPR domain
MQKPSNLNEKLNRVQRLIVPAQSSPAPDTSRDIPARYRKMAQSLGGELVEHAAGRFVMVKRFFPFDYRHGIVSLDETLSQNEFPLSAFSALERDGQVDLSRIVYFDTETTGLGGVGIVPFLIGCGSMVDRGFEVRQYLIPDYSDEAAMLEVLQEEFGEDKCIVTYNGAAFDLPVVRDRLIVNRVAREIVFGEHIDLLHSARRLFKRRLKECNLTHIERRLFEFHRQDDIPGYLVPSVFFDWLATEQLDKMVDVLTHNRHDIVSLHFLLAHVASAFATEGAVLDQTDDLYSLSRVYRRRNRTPQVLNLCKRIVDETTGAVNQEMQLFHAAALKRSGDWEQAVAIWLELSNSDSREGYRACLELAIYHEHRSRDIASALTFASRAEAICPYGPSERVRLRTRRDRLENKLPSP